MFEIKDNKQFEEIRNAFVANNFAEASADSLNKQVSAGSANILQEGDVIEFPSDMKFYENTSMRNALAMICRVTDKNGVEKYMPWYPTSLGKTIRSLKVDTDGKVQSEEFVRPLGAAAVEYQGKANLKVADVINEMAKNHPNGIKVTGVKSLKTYAFQDTSRVVNTNQYTFDWA